MNIANWTTIALCAQNGCNAPVGIVLAGVGAGVAVSIIIFWLAGKDWS